MPKTEPADAAFPLYIPGEFPRSRAGLTKREYIAIAALRGLLANPTAPSSSRVAHETSAEAISFADALIAELNK